MTTTIKMSAKAWLRTREHLLQNEVEQVAIGFFEVARASESLTLTVEDVYFAPPSDFSFQSSYHIELTEEAQARIIKNAWDRKAGILELHSHVCTHHEARFSPSDLAGFNTFVPHVMWRLGGTPYAAVVVTEQSFDALLWDKDPRTPIELDRLELDSYSLKPTGKTIRMEDADAF